MTRRLTRKLKSHLRALFRFLVSIGSLAFGEPAFWLMGMRGGAPLPELSRMQRILVLRLDQIGDVVMTTPLLRELRKNAPHARITLIVKPELRDLVSACPYIDEVLTFDWHVTARLIDFQRPIRALKFCSTHLWRRRFDLAITPRWDCDWYYQTFLAYFSGSRRRIGYSEDVNPIKQVHNRGYDRLLTQALHQNTLAHETERNLNVLHTLGGTVTQTNLEIWTAPADEIWAQNWLKDRQAAEDRPLVAFGPFVGNSSLKQWPLSNFAQLGRWLVNVSGGRILVLGGPGDQAQAQQLCDEIGEGALNSAGQCSLPQAVALLKRCSLYVGADSGPMHLAGAVGLPVVALFGPSCPHRFRPWTSRQQILWKQLPCSPCTVNNHADCCTVCIFAQPHCIQSITVGEVQAAVAASGFSENFLPVPPLQQSSGSN